ncbi:MAG: hypothetical protein K0S07_721 [Chlamydiales bacterium]|jgi:regulator of sigma E protease|nr:hypothetical protein [Chlamydiales bacterium]
MASFSYLLLALLGLGFLILIHEFGHYFMARRVGIKVVAFGIGFGQPLWSFERNGTRWLIGWIPFGGYVQLAGGEESEEGAIHEPGSFFASRPFDRIRVLLMGPLVNLACAFLLFTGIWFAGGRQKPLSEFTHTIGWVDPHSELYAEGVRPGDVLISFNDKPYRATEELLTVPMMSQGLLTVKGEHVDPLSGEKTPFTYQVKPYQHPYSLETGFLTSGILDMGHFLICHSLKDASDSAASPMANSGLQDEDRIVWMDGHFIYSAADLSSLLNEGRYLFTIERNGQKLLARVPKVAMSELKIEGDFKGEIEDWQFEGGIKKQQASSLAFIPYAVSSDCLIEGPLSLLDGEEVNAPEAFSSPLERPLEIGDRIIAVDGEQVKDSASLLLSLQQRRVHIIVEKSDRSPLAIEQATSVFQDAHLGPSVASLSSRIGLIGDEVQQEGNARLLKAITPKRWAEMTPREQIQQRRQRLQAIEDPDKRSLALKSLEKQESQLVLGVYLSDQQVLFNPGPVELFAESLHSIWKVLSALFSGALSPKWLAGPVGIVQTIQNRWEVSWLEGLFWLGNISLNLGVLNLLPLPVLDGGKILIFAFEWVTGRPIKPKTLERLLLPCAVLLVGFFVFITYHDLLRLFNRLFP